jgi:peptidoglycan/xylan/chitin deacetylase (PgdA/CDA1 family)
MKIIVMLLLGLFTFSTPCQVSVSFDLERDPPAINYGKTSFKGVEKTPEILDILDKHGVKGTFFITGRVADRFPGVVREIHARGHELAVQGGYYHDRQLKGLQREEQKAAILDTAKRIENITGSRPVGHRAPGHLVDENTLLALEELGFGYDSSIVPSIAGRYLYGHAIYTPDFPYHPSNGNPFIIGEMRLKEIPLTPVFLNGNLDSLLAYQGEAVTKTELLISVFRCKLEGRPLVVYLHPGLMVDLPNEPNNYRSGEHILRGFDEILSFLDKLNVEYVTLEEIAR